MKALFSSSALKVATRHLVGSSLTAESVSSSKLNLAHAVKACCRSYSQAINPVRGFESNVGGAAHLLRGSGCPSFAARGLTTSGKQTGSKAADNKIWQVLSAPSKAAASARQRVGEGSVAVYSRLPAPAKRWVDSLRQPNGFQKVAGLQLEAFWQQHRNKVIATAALFTGYFLWKLMFGVTSVFVNLSETMAELGFLALAAAMVAFAMLYIRHLYTINPQTVYRRAMVQLNLHPGLLEVMGAPLAGSDVRATVLTGGGLRMKGWRPRYRSRRVQMIFPLTGMDRRGLVSLEAKKQKGRYVFKLLAVDLPSATGAEQRVFLEGNEAVYQRGGVIGELRDPFLRAMSLKDTYEAEDERDIEVEELEEEAREAEAAAARPKPLDQGGGMFFWERAYWAVRRGLDRAGAALRGGQKAGTETSAAEVAEGKAGAEAEVVERKGGGEAAVGSDAAAAGKVQTGPLPPQPPQTLP